MVDNSNNLYFTALINITLYFILINIIDILNWHVEAIKPYYYGLTVFSTKTAVGCSGRNVCLGAVAWGS